MSLVIVCDRCGGRCTDTGKVYFAANVAQVQSVSMSLTGTVKEDTRDWHLCPPCAKLTIDFITNNQQG